MLYYEARGEGSALVLIHAGVADSGMFDPQWGALARHHHVARFDLRGFGRSPMPTHPWSNVDDVVKVMDACGMSRATLLGVSFGGMVATDAALAHPDRVEALILVAPSIRGAEPSERVKKFWAEEEALLDRGDMVGATELNLALWVDGPNRSPADVDPGVRRRVGEMQLRAFQVDDSNAPDEIEPEPAYPRLAELHQPTLVLVGEHDLPEKLESAADLVERLPNATKQVLAGGAHMVNMEEPDAFNEVVLRFTNGLA